MQGSSEAGVGGESRLAAMLPKLQRHSRLDEEDRAALLALPHQLRRLPAGAHIGREGDRPEHCGLLLSGFAFRHKITGEGSRQILAIHLAGEFVDLQNCLLGTSDHNVQTLTDAEFALIPRDAIRAVCLDRPSVALALWTETLIDGAVFREWVLNVGRRDSRGRVAHLLCEMSTRMEAAGLASERRYELPMTQEQLADAVGLTSVHVNRVLRQLEHDGLISRNRRSITIENWAAMREAGDFNERYLHSDAA